MRRKSTVQKRSRTQKPVRSTKRIIGSSAKKSTWTKPKKRAFWQGFTLGRKSQRNKPNNASEHWSAKKSTTRSRNKSNNGEKNSSGVRAWSIGLDRNFNPYVNTPDGSRSYDASLISQVAKSQDRKRDFG